MFWRNDRNEYGFSQSEKVQMYECTFLTTKVNPKNDKSFRGEVRVLVVCDTVEEAIAACRKQWPHDFVLHQIVKRNQRCDLIISDSVLGTAEPSA
jgi:CRISPR/Cas system-associated endonuclease/helicase Cas3